jgi:hypothetical protein
MTQTIYADGVGAFAIIDGVARLELVSLAQGADQKSVRIPSATLAMSLSGFVRAYQDMEKIVNKLIADGVLQRAPVQPQAVELSGPAEQPPN